MIKNAQLKSALGGALLAPLALFAAMVAVYLGAFYPATASGISQGFWIRFLVLMAPLASLGGAYIGWVMAKAPRQDRLDLWLFCLVLALVSIVFTCGDQRIFGSAEGSADRFLRGFAIQIGSVLVSCGLFVLIKRKGRQS